MDELTELLGVLFQQGVAGAGDAWNTWVVPVVTSLPPGVAGVVLLILALVILLK